MNCPPNSGSDERRAYHVVVHVADILFVFVPLTLRPHLAGDRQPLSERPRKKTRLPGFATHLGAKPLIGVVIGAPGIAVGKEHRLTEQHDHGGVVEEQRATALGPGKVGRAAAQQEVAVAAHERNAHTAAREPCKALTQRSRHLIRLIVAHPGLEDIPQQKQMGDGRGLRVQDLEKLRGGVRVVIAQVHVGGEKGRLARTDTQPRCTIHLPPTTVIDSITTGSAGTSAIGPMRVVFTPLMALTTSMPLITFPNTA